jgi:HSP20 family protein
MTYPFDDWFSSNSRRRKRSGNWFPDIDNMMRKMEKLMDEAFKNFGKPVPRKFIKERKLDDGSTIREFGPVVYGYSVKIGEDGKPIIRKFGNIDVFSNSITDISHDIHEKREPLIDIINGKEEIKIVAELPGITKENVKLYANENALTMESLTPAIVVTAEVRRYYKKIEFPEFVEPSSGKSHYKNGILEITFKKKNLTNKRVQINID